MVVHNWFSFGGVGLFTQPPLRRLLDAFPACAGAVQALLRKYCTKLVMHHIEANDAAPIFRLFAMLFTGPRVCLFAELTSFKHCARVQKLLFPDAQPHTLVLSLTTVDNNMDLTRHFIERMVESVIEACHEWSTLRTVVLCTPAFRTTHLQAVCSLMQQFSRMRTVQDIVVAPLNGRCDADYTHWYRVMSSWTLLDGNMRRVQRLNPAPHFLLDAWGAEWTREMHTLQNTLETALHT